ncbi:hypothetical protein IEQ34_006438 [Dendrobium chrysotoxum]|uniref:DYW domain-containing protein n=1 Tax=Dendrobium chrysotoxum TaxID=161865 RepID=A0AAV7GWS1_DENCH|nr:hypothetical protein IEQ34_006438 [Dendrobium chrysotoxum]
MTTYLHLAAAAGGGCPTPVRSLLSRCSSLHHLQQIHAHLTTHPLLSPAPLLHSLIRSAAAGGHLNYAGHLLQHFRPSSPIPWNFLIQAQSKSPSSGESIRLFRLMLALDSVCPDKYTYTFILTSCCREPSPLAGDASHAMALKSGFAFDLFVANSLVNMHSEFGRLYSAQRAFEQMPLKDSISWTNLIKGYAKQGKMDVARKLFDEMPQPNEVSWVILIAGYVKVGNYHDAVKLFNYMLQSSNDWPSEPVLVSVLSACTHIGALTQGRWIHAYIDKISLPMTVNITNALIDMYCKCGIIDSAKEVFGLALERDLLTWSCMISGLALHGSGDEALKVFREMVAYGVQPDSIAVLGVLNGCSHSGLVDEGCSIFYRMSQSWGITPEIEHYGCLIDLLGRAGQLQKALGIIFKMPVEPDIIIWRSLLSACRNYRNVELGERILDQIVRLDLTKQGGGHLLVSNLYAAAGRWEKVAKLRSRIRDGGEVQKPGWSCIEINGEVHEFVADDRLHHQIVDIRRKLNEVLREVAEKGGYVANTELVLFDLSEEDREQAVHLHSEKLAVSFGLMNMAAGCSIRVVKSLRICEDCHSAMKAISYVFDREIVVRDRSRFHTFKEGRCSCMDYCVLDRLWYLHTGSYFFMLPSKLAEISLGLEELIVMMLAVELAIV